MFNNKKKFKFGAPPKYKDAAGSRERSRSRDNALKCSMREEENNYDKKYLMSK